MATAGASSCSDEDSNSSTAKEPRLLLVVRHSERMDYEFGNQWISNVKEGPDGKFSLALPFTDPVEYIDVDIPKRAGGLVAFRGDTPITPSGHELAQQLGVNIRKHSIPISHVYSSPALRCVQTTHMMLKGLGLNVPIHVEPGLYELLSLRPIPTFMTLKEMQGYGLPVDPDYKVIWPESKYKAQETRDELYQRTHEVTQVLLDRHEREGGNVLIVAHAASLDTCIRQLLGHQQISNHKFYEALNSDYCEVKMIQENMKLHNGKKRWHEATFYLR